jgi:thiol-disulfide isomerase/thioredoxin
MLPAAVALAVLALAVCLLDLVFTLGVIRRLREHTELISNLPSMPQLHAMLAEGEFTGPFEAVASTGEPVTRDRLSGRTLVAAFTPHCHACEEKMPAFVDFAKAFPGGRDQVIAVVAGVGNEADAYRELLEPVARVVVEPPMTGEIGTALAVTGFPVFAVLDESGKVISGGVELDRSTAVSGV